MRARTTHVKGRSVNRSRSKTPVRRSSAAASTAELTAGNELLQLSQLSRDIQDLKEIVATNSSAISKIYTSVNTIEHPHTRVRDILGIQLHDGGYDDAFAMCLLLTLLTFLLGAADDLVQMFNCFRSQHFILSKPAIFLGAGLILYWLYFLVRKSYLIGFETTVTRYMFSPFQSIMRHWRMVFILTFISYISCRIKGASAFLQPCQWSFLKDMGGGDICCRVSVSTTNRSDPAMLLGHIKRLTADVTKYIKTQAAPCSGCPSGP
jgi:hypothetical protein